MFICDFTSRPMPKSSKCLHKVFKRVSYNLTIESFSACWAARRGGHKIFRVFQSLRTINDFSLEPKITYKAPVRKSQRCQVNFSASIRTHIKFLLQFNIIFLPSKLLKSILVLYELFIFKFIQYYKNFIKNCLPFTLTEIKKKSIMIKPNLFFKLNPNIPYKCLID